MIETPDLEVTPSVDDLGALRPDADAPDPDAGRPDVRTYRIGIDPVFTIGPKVHGGVLQVISAHAAVRAYAETAPEPVPTDGDALVPVAVSTEYLGSPEPAQVSVTAWIRKRGRRLSVVDVEIGQHGRTLVHSSVTMARLDTGAARYTAPTALSTMPVEPPADALRVQNSPMASVLNLAGAMELVYDPPSLPFLTGARGDPVTRLWARPLQGPTDAFFALLAGDLSAPVVMNLGLFGWAPTMQLTTYVRRMPAPGWLRVQASSAEVGAGWFEEDHHILDSTGALVAQSRQLALIPEGASGTRNSRSTGSATGGTQ